MPVRSDGLSSAESGALLLYRPGLGRQLILHRDIEDSLTHVQDLHEQVTRARNSGDEFGAFNLGKISNSAIGAELS